MDIDQNLDVLLKTRAVPDMRSNLEHRIIQKSLNQEKQSKTQDIGNFFRAVRDFMDCMVLPQPALAMVMVLVIGAAIGTYSSEILTVDDDQDVEAYMMIIDDIEYEDFL